MIKVQNICKTYKVAKRNKGLKEAARSLFKRDYEYIKALNDISFTIGEGETVGYIGPNGAGKSSTIKVLCGILTPDSGACEIAGLVPWKKRVEYVKNIGVVFGQRTQLSLGQRMKCEIAASLLHSPKILFLDEPTIGLDAISKLTVRKFISELNKKNNTTIILTTHDMQDIEAITERIILIDKGRILLDGTLNDIKKDSLSLDESLAEFYQTHC